MLDNQLRRILLRFYQKLHAIRIGKADYLVPAPFLPAVEAAVSSEDGSILDEPTFSRSVYRRAD